MRKIIAIIIAIAIPVTVGALSGFFTTSEITSWYAGINKPSFNPPNWIFGPVWTLLYVLMGIASYLVWKKGTDSLEVKTALLLYGQQLFFNFWWSFIFFYLHEPGWAFAEIIFLWLLILVTIFRFSKVSKTAAWLLVPYISWVSFAAILNYAIWQLNK